MNELERIKLIIEQIEREISLINSILEEIKKQLQDEKQEI